ncbi:Uncharacterised protein [Vibrio cholerae]|nr:Uncharacterised protein [Vibrio cholerae]
MIFHQTANIIRFRKALLMHNATFSQYLIGV